MKHPTKAYRRSEDEPGSYLAGLCALGEEEAATQQSQGGGQGQEKRLALEAEGMREGVADG